jgi:hypothetical protein
MLTSIPKAELITLFHKNPGLVDTVSGVARRIGRTEGEIKADVDDFVAMGLLQRKKYGNHDVVTLVRHKDKEIQAHLVEYFRNLKK